MREKLRIKIGDWTATPALDVLEQDGRSLKLEPRTMDVLVHLARHAGAVISTEELIHSVWQGRVVGDGAVYQSVKQLRQALGDDRDNIRYIQTIPKRGYRLIASVTVLQPDPSELVETAHQGTYSKSWVPATLFNRGITVQKVGVGVMSVLILAIVPIVVDHVVLEQDRTSRGTDIGDSKVRRYTISLGQTQGLWQTGVSTHVALSPDGEYLAYAARVNGTSRLYVRALDELETHVLPGTEGALYPFFSPDGEWLAFYDATAGVQLKKVSVSGGTPVALADTFGAGGGSWTSDDTIVFDDRHVRSMPWGSLVGIPATGGALKVLLASDSRMMYEWPDVLPGGKAILFTLRPAGRDLTEGSIAALSLETGDYRVLVEDGYQGKFAQSGHIIFARDEALWAVPFDLQDMRTIGPETLVLEGVQVGPNFGAASYAFSDDGLLVYAPRNEALGYFSLPERLFSLVWVDREGGETTVPAEPRQYSDRPRISPDNQYLALEVSEDSNIDIWIYSLAQRTWSRLTFEPSIDEIPLWTPDSERIVFLNHELGGLFSKAADGTGRIEQLTKSEVRQRPETFSIDGKQLVVTQARPGAVDSDLHLLSLDGAPESHPLVQTASDEAQARVSPDGRWIAYLSNETGQDEIHVQRFPNVEEGGQWQVSRGGGSWPLWGPHGTELFYRAGDAVIAVSIETEPTFSSGSPQILFSGDYHPRFYDVSPDGQRFLMMKEAEPEELATQETQLIVVENWFEELERLVPTEKLVN